MANSKITRRKLLLAVPAVACGIALPAMAQESREGLRKPVYRVSNNNTGTPNQQQVAVNQHPLTPAIELAENGLRKINANIKDYECTIVKREQVGGKILNQDFIYTKIRHEQTDAAGNIIVPFSVYMKFVAPKAVAGREVMYIKGHNNGNLTAHEGGAIIGLITVSLDPNSAMAMRGNRYPITEVGVKNLVTRLIDVAKADSKYGECDVNFFNGAKINGRVCTAIEVIHPTPRKNFRFHKAHIFIDDTLGVPIRYASWDWKKDAKGNPMLLEEYTYTKIKVNQGFTNSDFDVNNAQYGFN
ncbi:MAG: DUF1571 domain-containing protein [Pirellulales bacterium]